MTEPPRPSRALVRPLAPLPILGPANPSWRELTNTIRACTLCPLARTRIHAVPYRGGSAPWLVLVGEAPGAEEDRQGLPFVGRGGLLLDWTIVAAGVADGEYGIVNLLKCRPPRNRFDLAAAATCRPYLDRQLDLLRPHAIVSLGARALHALDADAPPMLEASGSPRHSGGRPLFPLVHPAAAFRSRRLHERWNVDSTKLAAWVASTRPRRS